MRRKMIAFLTEADAWLVAALLAPVMLAGWALGSWRGRAHNPEKTDEPANKFNDAVLALLGLLLAFTFSMSLARHEQRRQMVVTDSNSIGDFSTCVNLLNDPVRAKLQRVLRKYVEHRLALVGTTGDEAVLQ